MKHTRQQSHTCLAGPQTSWELPSSRGVVGPQGANGTEAPGETDATEGPKDTWACPLGYHPVEHALVLTPTDQLFLPPASGEDPAQETDPMGTVDRLSVPYLRLHLARLAGDCLDVGRPRLLYGLGFVT